MLPVNLPLASFGLVSPDTHLSKPVTKSVKRLATRTDDGTTTPKLLIDKKVQSFDLLGKAGGHDHEGCLPICDRCLLPNATGTTKAEKQFWIFDTTTLGSALKCCSTNRGGGGLSQEDNCGAYLVNVTDRPENTS